MNASETDYFDDMMGDDTEKVFPSLERFMKPEKSVQRSRPGTFPNGMAYQYHCPQCGRGAMMRFSWAELVVIAAGVRPQEAVGIEGTWQMDAEHPTGFGCAKPCLGGTCHETNAPFLVGIEEAKADLAQHPYHVLHPDVVRVQRLLVAFLAKPPVSSSVVFDGDDQSSVPVIRPAPVVGHRRWVQERQAYEEQAAERMALLEAITVGNGSQTSDDQTFLRLGVLALEERDPARHAILNEALQRLHRLNTDVEAALEKSEEEEPS